MLLTLSKSRCPIVPGPTSILGDEDVFLVEEVAIRSLVGELVDHAGLEVDEEGAWDVVLVVALVEEDVFAIVDEFMRCLLRWWWWWWRPCR